MFGESYIGQVYYGGSAGSNAFTVSLTEALSLVDTTTNSPSRIINEGITLIDNLIKGPNKKRTETITLTEKLPKTNTRVKSETITLTESIKKDGTTRKEEGIIINDSVTGIKVQLFDVLDELGIVDLYNSSVVKTLIDSITTGDLLEKVAGYFKDLSDSIGLSESYSYIQAIILTFLESILNSEVFIKNTGKVENEEITAEDSITLTKMFEKLVSDTLEIAETIIKGIQNIRIDSIFLESSVKRVYNGLVVIWNKATKKIAEWLKNDSATTIWSKIVNNLTNWSKKETNSTSWGNSEKESTTWSPVDRPSDFI